jgi:hypothetical protein
MTSDLEKLRVLLPHWIEHNAEHAGEFRTWAERGGQAGEPILEAAQYLDLANQALNRALEQLGGPMAHPPHGG